MFPSVRKSGRARRVWQTERRDIAISAAPFRAVMPETKHAVH